FETPVTRPLAESYRRKRQVLEQGLKNRHSYRAMRNTISCRANHSSMPEAKRRLNIAMIGSGSIARAHSNAFHQVSRFFEIPLELCTKVVCARDQAKLEAFAKQWGWEETKTEWQTVVGRGDIDVVDIAVPNALHLPIAVAAAVAGKIIFCEKPLALSQ